MKTKTSHSWQAIQGHQIPLPEQFKVKGSFVNFDSMGFNAQPKKDHWFLKTVLIGAVLILVGILN
jgi:hypothetical protein